jgi:hypothetical protein
MFLLLNVFLFVKFLSKLAVSISSGNNVFSFFDSCAWSINPTIQYKALCKEHGADNLNETDPATFIFTSKSLVKSTTV